MTLLIALPFLLTLPASAADSGEELFRQGKWPEAVAALKQQLAAAPLEINTAALYNLGTALAKSGAHAEAYAYLLSAHYRRPLDSDIAHNLSFVEKKLPPAAINVRPDSWLLWWPEFFRAIPAALWITLAFAAFAPFLWSIGNGSAKTGAPFAAIALLLLAVAACAYWQSRFPILAITSQSKMRSGPEASFQEITVLEPGSLVSLEETRDHWHKVRFQTKNSQSAVGWIESATALGVLP